MTHAPDPHVVSLKYKLRTVEHVTYSNPLAVGMETPEASFALDSGVLAVAMKAHHPDAASARSAVEPVLRAWETQAELDSGSPTLLFGFVDAQVVDRAASVQGPAVGHIMSVAGGAIVTATGEVNLLVTRNAYPSPPTSFRLTPDVLSVLRYCQELWNGPHDQAASFRSSSC